MNWLIDWDRFSPHPGTTLIVGPPRIGKTALICNGLDYFHKKDIDVAVLVARKTKAFPRWVRQLTANNKIPDDTVIGIPDAHQFFHSRDFMLNKTRIREWDIAQRERGHTDTSFIWDTQEARVIDVNIVSQQDALIVKRYNKMQLKYERSELKEDFIKPASDILKEKDKLKYAYCYANKMEWEDVIGPYDPPTWYNDEISKMFRDVEFGNNSNDSNPVKGAITGTYQLLKILGRSLKNE